MRPNILLIVFLFISDGLFAQGSNGLVAHWNFNGNANDVSGHGLNGLVSNASLTSGYNGYSNSAYYFNGSNSSINIPYNSLLNIDSGSICILLKVISFYSGLCQQNTVLYRGTYYAPSNSQDAYSIEFGDNYYDYDCNVYSLSHEVFDPSYHTSNAGYGGLSMWYANSDTIALNTWYCLTTTYKNDTLRLYIDGSLRKTEYMPDNYAPGVDSIAIGYYPPGGSQFPYQFNGIIDDIRIYNRPLSDLEAVSYCDTAKMPLGDIGSSTVQQSENNPELFIYPNPAHSNINIQLPYSNASNNIQLLNSLGQVLTEIRSDSKSLNLDIDIFPSGIYFIKATCDGQTIVKKFIKE